MNHLLSSEETRGFSLLELLLSIGIIALIILMATRYFTTARNAQLVGAAVQQIQGIRAAVDSMTASGVSNSSITATYICQSGGLPSSYCISDNIATPWAPTTGDTNITVTVPDPTNTADLFQLVYTFPTQAACLSTYNSFTADLDAKSTAISACATTGVGTFHFAK